MVGVCTHVPRSSYSQLAIVTKTQDQVFSSVYPSPVYRAEVYKHEMTQISVKGAASLCSIVHYNTVHYAEVALDAHL